MKYSHNLQGFASNYNELNLAKEIQSQNNATNRKMMMICKQFPESLEMDNATAKKAYQWHL